MRIGGGRFRAARDFFGDGDLMFEALLARRRCRRVAPFEALASARCSAPAQRVAGGAELVERFGDAFGRFARRGFRVFDARGKAEHGAVDGGDGAVEAGDRELRAAFDQFNALGEARGIGRAVRAADVPIVFGVVIGVREP